MFVLMVNYAKPLAEIDKHQEAHRRFLDEGYAGGIFLASGPRVPRTGGARTGKRNTISGYWEMEILCRTF